MVRGRHLTDRREKAARSILRIAQSSVIHFSAENAIQRELWILYFADVMPPFYSALPLHFHIFKFEFSP